MLVLLWHNANNSSSRVAGLTAHRNVQIKKRKALVGIARIALECEMEPTRTDLPGKSTTNAVDAKAITGKNA